MGSISRSTRCDQFKDAFEKEIVAKSPYRVGDLLEVVGVGVDMVEGEEVSKLYVGVKNKRTGVEDEVTFDECLFEPDTRDIDNVERLHDLLFPNQESSREYAANRKKVIKMLKDVGLVAPWFAEPA